MLNTFLWTSISRNFLTFESLILISFSHSRYPTAIPADNNSWAQHHRIIIDTTLLYPFPRIWWFGHKSCAIRTTWPRIDICRDGPRENLCLCREQYFHTNRWRYHTNISIKVWLQWLHFGCFRDFLSTLIFVLFLQIMSWDFISISYPSATWSSRLSQCKKSRSHQFESVCFVCHRGEGTAKSGPCLWQTFDKCDGGWGPEPGWVA